MASANILTIIQLTSGEGRPWNVALGLVETTHANLPPIANAGLDQTKNENSTVTLDGTASSDPDNDTLHYSWSQIGGRLVNLTGDTTATPTFTAPQVPSHSQETLIFQLVVDDGLDSSTDTVAITVMDVDAPPSCDLAQANPASLWPPNHSFVSMAIIGVTDPDNDNVTVTVRSITQDEPVNGLGDGDVSPDAVIQSQGTVLLRAERSGRGNGRVYEVHFMADDGHDGHCDGKVKVCAPHDRQPVTCVDDGQRFDATKP